MDENILKLKSQADAHFRSLTDLMMSKIQEQAQAIDLERTKKHKQIKEGIEQANVIENELQASINNFENLVELLNSPDPTNGNDSGLTNVTSIENNNYDDFNEDDALMVMRPFLFSVFLSNNCLSQLTRKRTNMIKIRSVKIKPMLVLVFFRLLGLIKN